MKIPNHSVLTGALESMGVGAEDHAPVVAVAAARQIAYELPIPASPVNSPTEAFEVHRPVVEAKLAEVNEVMPINDFDGAVETVRAHWGARVRAVHQPETLQGLVDARVMAAAAAPAPVETLDAVAATVGAIMDRPAVESYLYAPHELLDLGLDQAALESLAGNDIGTLNAHYDAVLLAQGLAMADIYAGLEDAPVDEPADAAASPDAAPAPATASDSEAEKSVVQKIVDAARRMYRWVMAKLKALADWVMRRKDKKAELVESVEKHSAAESVHAIVTHAEKIVEAAAKEPELVFGATKSEVSADAASGDKPAAAKEERPRVEAEEKKEVVEKVKAAGEDLKATLEHLRELEEKAPGRLVEDLRTMGERQRRVNGFFEWLPDHARAVTKVVGEAGPKELRDTEMSQIYKSIDADWAKGLPGEMYADKARHMLRALESADDGHRQLAVKDLIALWKWSLDSVVGICKTYTEHLGAAGQIRDANIDSDAEAVRKYWADLPASSRYARSVLQDVSAVHSVGAQLVARIGDSSYRLDQYMDTVGDVYRKLGKVIGYGAGNVELLVKAGVGRSVAENTVKIMAELKG